MSETLNITITNLTINVTAGQRRPAMSDLLESLLANLHIVPADENGKTDDAPAGDTASTVPHLLRRPWTPSRVTWWRSCNQPTSSPCAAWVPS